MNFIRSFCALFASGMEMESPSLHSFVDRVFVFSSQKKLAFRLPSLQSLLEDSPNEVRQSLVEYLQNGFLLLHKTDETLTPLGVQYQFLEDEWLSQNFEQIAISLIEALTTLYLHIEPLAGRFLQQASWLLQSGQTASKDEKRWIAVAHLAQAGAEEWLQKKKVDIYYQEAISTLFGQDLSVRFIEELANKEYQEALREQLAEQQQAEVARILQEEARLEAEKAKLRQQEQAPAETRSYPYGNRRNREETPIAPLTLGKPLDSQEVISIQEIEDEMRRAVVQGRVFSVDKRVLPSGRFLLQFNITDGTNSITAKCFARDERQREVLEPLKNNDYLRIGGQVQFDTFSKEIVFMVSDMQPIEAQLPMDFAEKKRIELHAHTNMSPLDGVIPVDKLIAEAARLGHKAIAVTDHGGVQAFPEAYGAAKKHGIRAILGVEAYVIDDGARVVIRPQSIELDDTCEFVVFDTETTGLNAREDTLIEIAAVRMRGTEIVDTFSTLIQPERAYSQKVAELTGITPEMLEGQPVLADALPRFREFVGDAVLVAHNAEFDSGFLNQCALRIDMPQWEQPIIDTLALARILFPGEKNYRLKTLTQKLQIELVNHHRALADSEATARLFAHMQKALRTNGITNLVELNDLSSTADMSKVRPFHATVLVKNRQGLRNLYELVSLAHTKYLYRTPRIPKSELARLRDGLLIGTACQQGELIESFIRGKSIEEIEEICSFYDYLEIQPLSHYDNLIREGIWQTNSLKKVHQQIVELGQRLGKPVVATGDVHYLYPQDGIFREVFLQSQNNGSNAERQPPLHFRTTEEMLEEFSFLGDAAIEVVVEAPAKIAEQIEDVPPIPNELYTPIIDGAEDEVRQLTYSKAKHLYGEELPQIVAVRLEKELHSIISHGFAVIYLIAHKLVTKSLQDGYLVGSRGSVGSSLVATMMDITEVNPLPPHYRCQNCKHSEFLDDGSVGSGFDLPKKDCPHCAEPMERDGQDIPFETFLGFEGDKVPDIDLNFSGEYQPRAHRYTEELFGRDHVFRAGTISAVAEKTAYGYVRKFAEERGLVLRNAEIERLVQGCTGVKRTTGQHPGGQVVVPSHVSIYDFSPVQYPADDKQSETLTTHFDYHSGLENCLLKLDILGHDDPTVIRMLQDLTGVDPKTIPFDDPQVLALFSGTQSLGVTAEQIRSNTGTFAIPEFGTKFVRQMLEDTKPTTFSELVRISGLSHGTDVWLNNAQTLIRNQVATLSEVICARDDIMVYLIYKGLEPARAFKIMESIRKGKGVKPDDEAYMREFGVPDWYIESGKKIKYMFPKAHATAYVIMAVRIAWFKVHYPLAFYATYFTVRADDFDVELMIKGSDAIRRRIEEIEEKGNAAQPKEKSLLTVLEVALEMVERGFRFERISLYQSDATRFLMNEQNGSLLPPFAAIPGVGDAAARNLAQARLDGPFLSIEDLQERSRVSKTVIEILQQLGCLQGMPESNQLSLFNI
ncbi:PolC-type DNA polymerase III [Alicyclobacillus tolerans]|uniref:DNA polymerase III PolC-type n=1 Tax=Alicyclobacillus tolerans TaxID=90970 RepID=A0A1M6RKR4_9BACL|nr:PolC-type DNA polymerase III [Alicyclobacillus montanus]SHK33020.1 DNA polymerase III catalytic subunit, PolC type [Alicyclobacillus montanus]